MSSSSKVITEETVTEIETGEIKEPVTITLPQIQVEDHQSLLTTANGGSSNIIDNGGYFDKLSSDVIKKIISYLPLSDKKSARLINSEWVALTNELLTIKVPPLCNETRSILCSHVGTIQLSHLYVTTLTDPVDSLITTKFIHGPKIVSIIFENAEINTDNMVWLLTQCYSVKEIQFVLNAVDQIDFKLKLKRLEELFHNFEMMKAINTCSRTLRSFVIKCNNGSNNNAELGSGGSFSSCEEINSNNNNLYFDCSIFKPCRFLQSFIIIQMPWLKLKNLDEMPLQIGHIMLQLEEKNNNKNNSKSQLQKTNWMNINDILSDKEEEKYPAKSHNFSSSETSSNNRLRNIGFIDFSGPVHLKSFKFTFRRTKIKRFYTNEDAMLSGQDILELLPKLRRDTVSKIQWFSHIQHYQIMQESTRI